MDGWMDMVVYVCMYVCTCDLGMEWRWEWDGKSQANVFFLKLVSGMCFLRGVGVDVYAFLSIYLSIYLPYPSLSLPYPFLAYFYLALPHLTSSCLFPILILK